MVVGSERIEHELKSGRLTVDVGADPAAAAATFECATTGAMYRANLDAPAIGALHRLFLGMPDMLAGMMRGTAPTMTVTPAHAVARWEVAAPIKADFEVAMAKADAPTGADPDVAGPLIAACKVEALRDEIKELRDEVKTLRRDMKMLIEMPLHKPESCPSGSGSPSTGLYNYCGMRWHYSLKEIASVRILAAHGVDLRKFPPEPDNSLILGDIISHLTGSWSRYSGNDGVEVIRLLVSMHIDVNHKRGNGYSGHDTALSTVRKEIAECKDTTALALLTQVRDMLVAAGAK